MKTAPGALCVWVGSFCGADLLLLPTAFPSAAATFQILNFLLVPVLTTEVSKSVPCGRGALL